MIHLSPESSDRHLLTLSSRDGRVTLCLNPSKSQFMRCATAHRLEQLDDSPISLCGVLITPGTSVRNLGVVMDSSLSFLSHINHVISSSFCLLRRIKCSIKALPFDTAKSLVNSFVIIRIDYCNRLLTTLPNYALDRLQRVMNAAARMPCGAGKYSRVAGLIRDRLHWLPVQAQHIQFKLCLMMYKAMHGLAPAYLFELCASSYVEGRSRSSARGDLVVQRTRTKFGGRAFVVAGPVAWNRLPCSVRNSPSLESFKTALKTFFFTADI